MPDTFSTTKDIFAVGTWNGDPYTIADLDDMVKNFNDLKDKDNFRVPLKIDLFKGTKPEGQRHGGQPAFGWITDLKRIGGKLFANIENIPKTVKELIDSKAYRQVSSEIIWNFKKGGETLKRVLAGVALLGVEMSGVSNLEEFGKLYSLDYEDNELFRSYIVEETKSQKIEEEDINMSKELEAKVLTLEAQVKEYTSKVSERDEQIKTLTAKVNESTKLIETKDKEISDGIASRKESEIKSFIDSKVKEGKLLPKDVAFYTSQLMDASTTKMVKFTENDKEVEVSQFDSIKKHIEDTKEEVVNIYKEISVEDKGKGDAGKLSDKTEDEREVKMEAMVKEYMDKNKVDYKTAGMEISKTNPELFNVEG